MTEEAKKPKILIVEDTPAHAHILIESLHQEFALSVATNGEQALQQARGAYRPDIILLDVVMPGMNGYEVCRQLKSDEQTRHIPVIFTSALSEEQDERQGFEVGGLDYISKPFRPALVRARIHNQLELKQHRDHLAVLVKNRTHELQLTREATIFGLGILAEFRDTETGMHIRRTQSYVSLLARDLTESSKYAGVYDQETLHLLVQSAPLHDIGKVGIPDRILRKPSSLTAEEFEQIKRHTLYGRDVLDRIEATMRDNIAASFLRFAKEITYTHHENWDGTGYHGLRGEDIPLSGRLMSLADVYDALTSKRIYKEAFSHETAVKIITEGDGRTHPEHFDPDVLDAFVRLHEIFKMTSSDNFQDY